MKTCKYPAKYPLFLPHILITPEHIKQHDENGL